MTTTDTTTPGRGRMPATLGAEKVEELRQKVLTDQRAARAEAAERERRARTVRPCTSGPGYDVCEGGSVVGYIQRLRFTHVRPEGDVTLWALRVGTESHVGSFEECAERARRIT